MSSLPALTLSKIILNSFEVFFNDFQQLTLGAQQRFEDVDWHAVQDASSHRLSLYKKTIRDVAVEASKFASDSLADRSFWQEAKAEYAVLVQEHNNFEIAQTFFNSVYCHVFKHTNIRDLHAFVMTPEKANFHLNCDNIVRHYELGDDVTYFCQCILNDIHFDIPFENEDRDVKRVANIIKKLASGRVEDKKILHSEVLSSLFFRNKAAYLIGRIIDGEESLPFVLPFLNNECGEVYVDTVLFMPDDISILFSFARSYFMVDASIPSQYVSFLKSIMPNKEVFELYNAIGFGKHGKTEFYRKAVASTLRSDDQYVIAPGIKGMVMLVFTRPSFDYVYKVIKDRFTPPKDMSRQEVKDKYFLVKRWDRVGRMAETQEFNNLAFDRRRFSNELMDELYREVPSLIEEKGNALILNHVYVERKMTPLNLFLRDANDQQVDSVMDEYGNAIKQLAGANIFPGDMLLKNFGVTRHGRVVFYDYDEICPLTECHFRDLPQPKTEEQEMASSPWYDVAPEDIFPEEFRFFFSGNSRARHAFERSHSNLYQPDFWIELQKKINNGEISNVYPYRRKYRFPRDD